MHTLTFADGTKKEQFALTCSVLEEDAACEQVRWGGGPCSCPESALNIKTLIWYNLTAMEN
ncbi:MAG: hypothetical protein SO116_06635, partial [Treponema sp.]|nr:hypothetical protein [Treponema sp.]